MSLLEKRWFKRMPATCTCFSSSLDTKERSEISLYSVGESDGGQVLGIGIAVESFQVEGKIPNSIV